MKESDKEYPNLIVSFVIEYNDKFLLVSRSPEEENYPSIWAFPGGKVEVGETVVDALKREIKEETGLEISNEIAFLNSYIFKNSVGVTFLVRAINNKVKLSRELTEYKWISDVDEMKKHKCIPGIYNHLVRAKQKIKENKFDNLEEIHLIESKYINKN